MCSGDHFRIQLFKAIDTGKVKVDRALRSGDGVLIVWLFWGSLIQLGVTLCNFKTHIWLVLNVNCLA